MKRLIMSLILICFLAGCQSGNITMWALGTPETDSATNEVQARIGYEPTPQGDGASTEFGIESAWLIDESQSYGAYLLVHGADTPVGRPYIGFHATMIIGDLEDAGSYGPVTGTLVKLNDRADAVVEYQYREFVGDLAELQADNNDRHKVFAGVRIKF